MPGNSRMAAIKLPDRLSLGTCAAKNWKLFKQRWDTYSIITELSELSNVKQKALFVHCLDDDALEAYNTFELSEISTVKEIIEQFEIFIVGEANVTYERYCFNRRNQEEGENFELFLADIQRLIKTCDFCDKCRSSILKDRIVLGIRDSSVQKDLLKIRDLTLEKAVDICKASQNAVNQNIEMRPSVFKVVKSKSKYSNNDQPKFCKFCGSSHVWGASNCPAFGKICKSCGNKNHFFNQC